MFRRDLVADSVVADIAAGRGCGARGSYLEEYVEQNAVPLQ